MPDSSDQSQIRLSSTTSFDNSSSTASFDELSSTDSFEKSSSSMAVQKVLSADRYEFLFKGFIDAVRKLSVKKLSTSTIALLTGGSELSKKRNRRKLARIRSAEDTIDCRLLLETERSWRNFEYSELASATDDFTPESLCEHVNAAPCCTSS